MQIIRCNTCNRKIEPKLESQPPYFCANCDPVKNQKRNRDLRSHWESKFVPLRILLFTFSIPLIGFLGAFLPEAIQRGNSGDVMIFRGIISTVAILSLASIAETIRSGIAGEVIIFKISFIPLFQAPKRRDEDFAQYAFALGFECLPVLLAALILISTI